MFITTRMSCSIRNTVTPLATNSADEVEQFRLSDGFMPAAGSSSSSRDGAVASARAISRRRWSP